MSVPSEQIILTSLADEIAFRLQAAILAGELAPGTHLYQGELCERFGVSRTPVREALRKLQPKHLVVLVPNGGATVRVPARGELTDVYDLCAQLEGYACELACASVNDDLLATLERAHVSVAEAVALYEDDLTSGTADVSLEISAANANGEFHAAVAVPAGKDHLRTKSVSSRTSSPKTERWMSDRPDQPSQWGLDDGRVRALLRFWA